MDGMNNGNAPDPVGGGTTPMPKPPAVPGAPTEPPVAPAWTPPVTTPEPTDPAQPSVPTGEPTPPAWTPPATGTETPGAGTGEPPAAPGAGAPTMTM